MFYDILSKLCSEQDITPNKACVDCGISRTSVAKWKKGATPNGVTIAKLANYFGVSTDYLLGETQIKKAPAEDDERKVSDDDIKFALFGTREIDDDVLDRVKQFAKFAQHNEKNK